ncbi:hypothetical protein DSO57_1027002 [Entomophthora muscae]|uniref:Uncharacterized protein n=1 Tax=Entomophthora muscae TaxID=34485 RepID=A0ACC2TNW4_9FUNG|nr:hypothetical protein DSO57_1027002 [Entomophthora muscae]
MTTPSSWSLATIQDTLWGLVDRNPTPLLDCINMNGLKEFGLPLSLGGFGNLPGVAILFVDTANIPGCDFKLGRNIPNCHSPVQAVEESFTLIICQPTPALGKYRGILASRLGTGDGDLYVEGGITLGCAGAVNGGIRHRCRWLLNCSQWLIGGVKDAGAGSGNSWIKSVGSGDNWVHSGGVSNLSVPSDTGVGDFGGRP